MSDVQDDPQSGSGTEEIAPPAPAPAGDGDDNGDGVGDRDVGGDGDESMQSANEHENENTTNNTNMDVDENDDDKENEKTESVDQGDKGEEEKDGGTDANADANDDASAGGDADGDGDGDDPSPTPPDDANVFGGTLPDKSKPAFALLAGIYEDIKNKDGPTEHKLSVPVTILPAILGRTSSGSVEKQKHMIDLGNCKQLSRKHAVIFYCDMYGGTLGNDGGKHPPPGKGGDKADSSSSSSNPSKDVYKVDNDWSYRYFPTSSKSSKNSNLPSLFSGNKRKELPQKGFFAIECLSKNKIIVDGKRIDQGKVAPLHHNSTIKMLTYTLYFLLPEDVGSTSKTVSIPRTLKDAAGNDHGGATGGKDANEDGSILGSPSPAKRARKENEWEGKPVEELLDDFNSAVENDNFDRKASMISTHILQHAVVDGSKDSYLQEMSKKENGISRHLLIEWIANSELYGTYVNNLLTKLEVKSYQQNLSKAMIKGGYQRIGNAGRHIKWLLPEVEMDDEMEEETKKDSHEDKDTDTNPTENDADENDAATTDVQIKKEILGSDTKGDEEDPSDDKEGDNDEDEEKSTTKIDTTEHESLEDQNSSDNDNDDEVKKESDGE